VRTDVGAKIGSLVLERKKAEELMRFRALRHPNVWLPFVAIGSALWAYTEIGLALLGREPRLAAAIEKFTRSEYAIRGTAFGLLILVLVTFGGMTGLQLAINKQSGRKGVLIATLVAIAMSALPHGLAIWDGSHDGSLPYVLARTALFLSGQVMASILIYLAYRESVPSPFVLVGSPTPTQ
jgi:hypothetical protein